MKLKSVLLASMFCVVTIGCGGGDSAPKSVTDGMSENDREAAIQEYQEREAALAAQDAEEEDE